MYRGELVETGSVNELFASPREDYTRRLLTDVPRLAPATTAPRSIALDVATRPTADPADSAPVVAAEHLTVHFRGRLGSPGMTAVDDVSFRVEAGEMLGIVGESGSGTSTTGRTVAGLQKATSGSIMVLGQRLDGASSAAMRRVRAQIGMVFQDPAGSLNPHMTVGEVIETPLRLDRSVTRTERRRRVSQMLESVELPDAYRERMAYELSGGQAQRVSLARALIRQPRLLIADEPTSALDVSVQARVLEVLQHLQRDLGFASIFITHDLAVVSQLADRVAVMQHGRLVEVGATHQVLFYSQARYTTDLVAAVPIPDPGLQRERRRAWEERRSTAG